MHKRLRCGVVATILGISLGAPAAAAQRSQAEVRAFRSVNPCPSTGLHRGACPGHQVDHARALCAGGLDHRSNMQWLSIEDHRWKTFVDVRECRKMVRAASRPAAPDDR